MRNTVLASMVLVLVGCSGEDMDGESLADFAAPQGAKPSLELVIGPRIAQPGTEPAAAEDALGLGIVNGTAIGADREIQIQYRKPGEDWATQDVQKLGADGRAKFDARPNREYRAKAPAKGKNDAVKSEVYPNDWSLVFDDEFGGSDLDWERWALRQKEYDPASKNRTHSKADAAAVKVNNGTLRLLALADPVAPLYHLNGHIITRADKGLAWTSGWFAARIKFHPSAGSHGCFWLTNGYAPGNAEVDVAESFGKGRVAQSKVYWDWDGDGENSSRVRFLNKEFPDETWDEQFHVFSVRWEAGKFYEFYLDGRKYWTMNPDTKAGVATNSLPILLSMLTNDCYQQDKQTGKCILEFDPNGDYKMMVDWVRVWQGGAGASASAPPEADGSDDPPEPADPTSGNHWFLSNAFGGNGDAVFDYGDPGDIPIVGDWNGDGRTTQGVLRGDVWYLSDEIDPWGERVVAYGIPGDVPVVGDWNGDGIDTPGIFRNGEWHLRNDFAGGNAEFVVPFGLPGDIPVVGDWNGDGIDTPAIFRNGEWHIRNDFAGGVADTVVFFGQAGDIPVPGDWDGDGMDTVGVVRNGTWMLTDSRAGGAPTYAFAYGVPGDHALAGNWDGIGGDSPGVHR